jgi:23S rRNA (uracil1939-C5)-methyltransferase
VRLTVDRLGHVGDGIAQGPEGPVFVPRALPGEVVEGTLQGDRLADPRIAVPVADRVRPPCPHARSCGGCAMQHAADPLVARWKEGIVAGALAGQGLAAPLRAILTSPPRSRRRATFSARRTRGGATVGFHAAGSAAIVAVTDCHLIHPDLAAALPAVAALAEAAGSRSAAVQATVTRTLGGPDIALTGAKPADAALRRDLAALAEAHGLSRLSLGAEVMALRAPPQVALGPARVMLPPGAFLQATEPGEAALQAAVAEAVGASARIADLFAGCGTFALPLAARAAVHAVEGEAAATAALVAGWRGAGGLHALTAETRDLFRRPLLPAELNRFDAVVIDPPRAGAEAQVQALAASTVAVAAMVSCNPASFARDARILAEAGWRIDWVQPVDQFRWSAHVELVARLTRA